MTGRLRGVFCRPYSCAPPSPEEVGAPVASNRGASRVLLTEPRDVASSHKPTSKSLKWHRLSPCRPCPKMELVRQSIRCRSSAISTSSSNDGRAVGTDALGAAAPTQCWSRARAADADDVLWRSTEPVAVRPSLCGIASAAGCACRNSPFRRRTRRRSAWRRAHRARRRARRACAPPTDRSQRAPPG